MSVVAMGMEPFLDALVIFWLVGVASSDARKARDDPRRLWWYLGWLAAILATFRAFGLVTLLTRGQPRALTSTAGLVSLLGLVAGSMALLGMGRLIDRYGVPAGYGVWLLFGVDGLLRGVHAVVKFVGSDTGDPQLTAIVVGYAVTSVILVGSAILVASAVGEVVKTKPNQHSRRNEWRAVPLRFLVGAFILPVVLATQVIILPLIPLEGFYGLSAQQVRGYWSPESLIRGVNVAYNAVYVLVLVAACFISMNTSSATEVGNRGRARGKATSSAAASAQLRVRSVTLLVGLWMAVVVVLIPFASALLLGPRPRLPLGGGEFVVTAAVLINVAIRLRAEVGTQFTGPVRPS